MMTALGLLPLLLLLLIVVGSGFIGLVFIALMNIGITFGSYYYMMTDVTYPPAAEQSND